MDSLVELGIEVMVKDLVIHNDFVDYENNTFLLQHCLVSFLKKYHYNKVIDQWQKADYFLLKYIDINTSCFQAVWLY